MIATIIQSLSVLLAVVTMCAALGLAVSLIVVYWRDVVGFLALFTCIVLFVLLAGRGLTILFGDG